MLRVGPATTDEVGSTNGQDDNKTMLVSPLDLSKHKEKTNFYLRISEIVQENSSQVKTPRLEKDPEHRYWSY